MGVLTTQERPCPVHQSSEASHPSPRHPAGTPSPAWPYMGTFRSWVAGGSPGGPNATVPPPPARLGTGLMAWWGLSRRGWAWQCPGHGRHSGHMQQGPPARRWPAAWILIPLSSAWTPLDPTPACPLAAQPGSSGGPWPGLVIGRIPTKSGGWQQWRRAAGPASVPGGPGGATPCSVSLSLGLGTAPGL